ncbi:MAG: metal-sensitive transcriptional regulator [Clostridiales bacterium]|nr:metal-sensitive transcriptional regulator [Clostridiales bacterium]
MNLEHEQQKKAVRKAVDNRLATIEGHIKAIRKMLEDDKDCIDLITQLMAVERSVRSASMAILNNHLDTCVKEAVENGDVSEVEEMHKLLEMFL